MATRPTSNPLGWTATGVEPTAGKKAAGYAGGEKPPSGFLNWFKTTVSGWLDYLRDGREIYFHHKDDDDPTCPMLFTDSDARARNFVDHNGYIGGRVIQQQLMPRQDIGNFSSASTDDVLIAGQLWASTDTNTTVDAVNPNIPFGSENPHNSWELVVLNAAVDQAARIHGWVDSGVATMLKCLDDVVYIQEWVAAVETVGANEVDIYMGLSNTPNAAGSADPDAAATEAFVHFRKESADTNWKCSVGDANAGTVVDSGVAPTAATWQTFRIELHGVNTPLGVENSSATALFFVDGVLVAEIADANVPAGTTLPLGEYYWIGATGTGPSADLSLYVGPTWKAWNTELGGYKLSLT